MASKTKTGIQTRSQRQSLATQDTENSSSDEKDRGIAPATQPSSTGKIRRRPLRKRLEVLVSSDGEEDGKTTNGCSVQSDDDKNDSESTTDDDSVEWTKEIERLPIRIAKVRELILEIAKVCDSLEQALTIKAIDQDVELEVLKKKLANLTEKCYCTVFPAIAKNNSKQDYRSSRTREEVVDPGNVQSTSINKIFLKGIDNTEYVVPDDYLPVDESAKDSGNPSSGYEESVIMKTTDKLATHVDLESCSPTTIFYDYVRDPTYDAHDDITEEQNTVLNTKSVKAPVSNNDPENLYNPMLFQETDFEEIVLKMSDSVASDNVEDSVINDAIFNIHSYVTPENQQSAPPVVRRILTQDVKRKSDKLQKQASYNTPIGLGMNDPPTGLRLLITDAKPNFSTLSTVNQYQPAKMKSECETLYQANPGSSKNLNVQLISMTSRPSESKLVSSNLSPSREPTKEEKCYIVPHFSKFSVTHTPSEENYELPLMKREIKMRLRVNDLSWVTQRAIRNETSRVKKVSRNIEQLEMEMKRVGHMQSANQLILGYDAKNKTFIRVHPELVAKMKPHQKEGVKFMYDCCYGDNIGSGSAGSGCILAHCMGLGKTMQVIALVNTVICYPQLMTKRIIVVCPKSTVMNWAQEIRHWLGDIISDVSVQVFYLPDHSNILQKMEVLQGFYNVIGNNAHCLLIGYEAFRALVFYDARNINDEHNSERVRTEVRRILINPGPDLIILDEGHIINNLKSQTNLSISEVATRRRIILTGIPIQNNLNEYFCMVSFVKPAYLGNEREFNESYAKPIRGGQHKDSNRSDIWFMKMKSFILHKHLANFVQRKEFSVLQGLLPEKYEYVLYVPLTPIQEDLYEQYLKRNPFQKDVGGKSLLEDYTFMRKIWTHPIVLERAWENAMRKKYCFKDKRRAARHMPDFDSSSEDEDENDADNARSITNVWWKQMISTDDLESLFPSNKMLLLFEILQMCQERGEKCLIFSGLVMVLNTVEYFMKKIDEQSKNPKAHLYGFSRFRGPWRPGMDYYRLDGGTSKSTRHEMITKFNDPKNQETRAFLISTKAGGQGISLVGANRVVILDTSWNLAVDQQGIFRIYRLGQQKPCYIYRLLALHTMEEKVYSRAVTKQAMSHRVADKKQVDRNYNMAELEELYHFERVNMSARPNSAPAVDDVLSTLLLKFPNLIFRYHMQETMLGNETEEDLTDKEKEQAWNEFNKKALTINLDFGLEDDKASELVKAESQMSEIGIDQESQNLYEYTCVPKCDFAESNTVDTVVTPLAIPDKQFFGKKFNEKLLELDPDPVEDESIIFGHDPYNELTISGSIIEEQRKKLDIKQEPDTTTPSQVTLSEDEIDLLRFLEEESGSAIQSVQIKNNSPEHSTQHAMCNTPVADSTDIRDPSYEGTDVTIDSSDLNLTDTSTMDANNDTLSSMIEYDPLTSSPDNVIIYHPNCSAEASPTEPSTYEKFEASLNSDPNVATSTTAPPSVVLVLSALDSPSVLKATVEPPVTRSMKRKLMVASSAAVTSKKVKIYPGNICNELLKSSTSYQSNQCRSLIPYVDQNMQCISLNVFLKQYIVQNDTISIPSNNCRSIVPYVKRVSLLRDILLQDSSLLPVAQVDTDVIDAGKINSQAVFQTTTLSWNGEDVNFADLDSCYDESSGIYYTADTNEFHDDGDRLTLTQCTLPDTQYGGTQQITAQNDNEELMKDLQELRAALSDEINPHESEADCSALVLYNPVVSLRDPKKYEYFLKNAVPLYRPCISCCDVRLRMRFYQAERTRQIIRNQRNKCYRFKPYNKDHRPERRRFPVINERSSVAAIPTKIEAKSANERSMTLLPYSQSSFLEAIQEEAVLKPKSVVFCSELVEYLSFCRNVTYQSTSKDTSSPKAIRGIKRRCENTSHVLIKKWKH